MPYENNKEVTAEQKEQYDFKKIKLAELLGYTVLEIWSTDSIDVNLNKCKELINEKIKSN